jgi:predicted nucleotidyltransferase
VTSPSELAVAPPPTEEEVRLAVAALASTIRRHYGADLKGIYLFGSRARRDHHAESDADVAVVLADDDWAFWPEKMRLTDLAYDAGLETGAYIQVWPVRESEWREPGRHRNPSLVKAMRRDGIPVEELP